MKNETLEEIRKQVEYWRKAYDATEPNHTREDFIHRMLTDWECLYIEALLQKAKIP